MLLSCSRSDYLPEKRDNVGDDAIFNTKSFSPTLGRTTQYTGMFYPGSTTFPSSFKIVNARRMSTNEVANELTDLYPVSVWTKAYTGDETSVAEIEAKKEIQYRSVLEVGASSGNLTMWSMGNSSFIKSVPDSGYTFDILVSNSGGSRYFTGFRLQPLKERPYEPSNIDASTGQPISNGTNPSFVGNVLGDSTNRYLSISDVDVFIKKVDNGSDVKNKLTFRFFDKNYNPIDPDKFNTTNWTSLIHGFNMVKTATSVTYDVSYPLPAVKLPTRYTDGNGDAAYVEFSYNRIGGFGGITTAFIGFYFAIYENANWEIDFVFSKDNPRFTNE